MRRCNLSRVRRYNEPSHSVAVSRRSASRRVNNREIVIVFQADRPTTTRRPVVYDAGIKMGICGVCGRGEVEGAGGEKRAKERVGWVYHVDGARICMRLVKTRVTSCPSPPSKNQSLRAVSFVIRSKWPRRVAPRKFLFLHWLSHPAANPFNSNSVYKIAHSVYFSSEP